jgi:hypothetical protein
MKPIQFISKLPHKQKREALVFISLILLAAATGHAQTTFTASSLPCQIGECNRSYFSSNVDVTAMLALSTNSPFPLPGGPASPPQVWNFSQAQQTNESVLCAAILDPTDGGDYEQFPNASYVEQDTLANTNIIGWEYFGFTNSGPSPGRICYGTDEPFDQPVTDWAVFEPPPVDIPSVVQYGQKWTYSLYWTNIYIKFCLVSNYCNVNASVDAYGTMILPNIGAVPALRVHETHTYVLTKINSSPLLIDIHFNEFYYWLVPGLGVAAEVTLYGNNTVPVLPIPPLSCTNSVQRMFSANYFTNSNPAPPPLPPTDLYIRTQSNSIVLNWNVLSNAINYRIDAKGAMGAAWETLGYSSGTSWTDSMTPSSRFYRVVGIP